VKDTQSDEERSGIYVTATETRDLSGSRGTANFVRRPARRGAARCPPPARRAPRQPCPPLLGRARRAAGWPAA